MQQESSWTILCGIQRQLKKQFLLVEKQQQEKIKLKRQIEDSIRSFHALSIQIKDTNAQLLKDEGFGNCYNFIKDVVIGISTSIQLGKKIIYLAQDQSTLVNLIIQNFYQSVQTNDPYLKDITKLMHKLISQLFSNDPEIDKHHKQRIIQAWKYHMEKVQHQHYFQQISNSTLKQLLKDDRKLPNRSSIRSQQSNQDDYDLSYSWEVKNKDQLVQEFIETIQRQALLAPTSLKIPLKAAFNSSTFTEENQINRTWQMISGFYLKPFKIVSQNSALPVYLRERILNFVNHLITNCKFVSQLSHQNLGQIKIENSNISSSIIKICKNIVDLNQERYNQCFLEVDQQNNSLNIQIKILGASLNLIQLHELLILLNTHKQTLAKVSEKVIHRTQRIFQMSPNLQILKRQKPSLLYISLGQLRYQESISSDYYKNYTNTYRSQTLKQILKQVLVELESLNDYQTSKHVVFSQIFTGVVQRSIEKRSRNNFSAQLQMKVKYLIYLLKGKNIDQYKIISEMNNELKERNIVNIKLFEDTKFSLLKVYCNLRNLKLQLKGRQQSQKKSKLKLSLLDRIQSYHLNYCISSRASRNKSTGEDSVDFYRYRMSSADQILISHVNSCIHKQNVFTGTQFHANTIMRFLKIFSSLPQVKFFMSNPSFMKGQGKIQMYTYCNQNKIKQAFNQFIKQIIQKLKIQPQEKLIVESILYRKLSQLILGKDYIHIHHKDRQLNDKIQSLLLEKQGREVQSPRKQGESNKKRRGSVHYEQGSLNRLQIQMKGRYDSIQFDQLIEIGSRHISNLNSANSPHQKIRKLKQLLDIYRTVIDKNDPKAQQIIQKLLINSIINAKLTNFISNLSYIEMFLPEDKLISSEGMVLSQFQKAVLKIFKLTHSEKRNFDRNHIFDC